MEVKNNKTNKKCVLWTGSFLGRLVVSLFEISSDGEYKCEINGENYKVYKKGGILVIELMNNVSNKIG